MTDKAYELLTHGSLFSGIGGFDLAAEKAGFKNVFHCEINEFCRQVLNYHFPKSISHADITKTDFTKYRGQITVLSGGFPCQPFSVSGQRNGTDDDRYLWPEMLRAIREIEPAWIIGENVTGILSMAQPGSVIGMENQTSLFEGGEETVEIIEQEYIVESICKDLEQIGYSVQAIVIPACAVGAPHRRDRIWFIANRNDRQCIQQEREIQTRRNSFDCNYSSYPNSKIFQKWFNITRWKNSQKNQTGMDARTERPRIMRFVANPKCGGWKQIHNKDKQEESGRNGIAGISCKRDAPYTGSIRLQERIHPYGSEKTILYNTARLCSWYRTGKRQLED